MHKIKIKGLVLPIITIVLGAILATTAAIFIKSAINIDIFILALGVFTAYLILNFVIYSRATAGQIILFSIINMAIFKILTALSLFAASAAGVQKLIYSANLSVNPIAATIALIAGFAAVNTLIKFETQRQEPEKEEKIHISKEKIIPPIVPQQKIEVEEVKQPEQQELTLPEMDLRDISEKETPSMQEAPQEDLFLENITETTHDHQTVDQSDAIIASPEEFIVAPQQELYLDTPVETSKINLESQNENIPAIPTSNIEEFIGALPEILLDESAVKKDEQQAANEESIFAEDNENHIPESVRLVERLGEKKVKSAGQISSIGKLLVNQKHIENIIELNEALQQVENDADGSNIITKMLGEQLKEKLAQIKSKYSAIKECTISNKAGFTIASTIHDNSHEHTVGAISSGAFLALQNYLTRLEFNKPTEIFFETEENVHILIKVDNFIFYLDSEKEFKPVEFTQLQELMEKSELTGEDLASIKDINGIISTSLSDKLGKLIESADNDPKLATISSAIFENLRVFVANIHPAKLLRMVIFSDAKVLTINKPNDVISAFLTNIEGPVTFTENIKDIEQLIK